MGVADETMETNQQETKRDSDRDTTVSGLTILEALSASGLRSIRYAQEIRLVDKIIANDISEAAYESICKNAKENGVGDKVVATCSDATLVN